jgi:nucleotide-binding universal stress UspA family protein
VVSTELAQAADTADLVVLGRGGLHTRLSHALLGSVVESVVRRSGKPILVTAEPYAEVERPLLATDGSPAAMAALHMAATVVRQLGLTLRVVHCTPTPEDGQPCLDDALAQLAIEGLSGEADVCIGNAHEDLVRYLRDHGHDLLFMGAFGHQRIVEWVLGSTTLYLLRTCPVPLMFCHEVSDG